MDFDSLQMLANIRHEILSTRQSTKEEEIIAKLDELILEELTTKSKTEDEEIPFLNLTQETA